MISIKQKPYGYKLTYSGIVSFENMKDWFEESEKVLADSPESFCVLIDMRNLEVLPADCRDMMYDGQKLYKRMGMQRSVVIVADKLTAMQFRLIAQKTGIYDYERYINANENERWEEEALNWLQSSIEPFIETEIARK